MAENLSPFNASRPAGMLMKRLYPGPPLFFQPERRACGLSAIKLFQLDRIAL